MSESEPSVPEEVADAVPKRRRRGCLLAAALATLAIVGVGAYLGYEAYRGPELHAGTPPPAAANLTSDEQAYYDYVAPRSHQLIAELRLLADMGDKKSRNIIVLERHYSAASDLINEIQTYQAQHPLPARFAPSATPLAAGIDQVDAAMSAAQSAFFKFQFDKLGQLLGQFRTGADSVDLAVSLLDQLGGGTPPALTSPSH